MKTSHCSQRGLNNRQVHTRTSDKGGSSKVVKIIQFHFWLHVIKLSVNMRVVEFHNVSGVILIYFYISMNILKGFFLYLLRWFEAELSNIGHFQCSESIFEAKHQVNLPENHFLF